MDWQDEWVDQMVDKEILEDEARKREIDGAWDRALRAIEQVQDGEVKHALDCVLLYAKIRGDNS